MSTDIEETKVKVPAKMEPAESRITFQIDPKRHPLSKALKKLDKDMEKAMAIVLEVMQNTELDAKTRLTAAQYWVDTKIKVNQEIAKEILARQIAEVRMIQATQVKAPKLVEEDDEDDTPRALFSPQLILKVDATKI